MSDAPDRGGSSSEPSTPQVTSSRGNTRLAWRIHWCALVVLVALSLVVFWDDFTEPPRGILDLRGAVAVFLAAFLVGYTSITTVLMVWLSRRTLGPIVLHLLGLGGFFGAMWLDGDL